MTRLKSLLVEGKISFGRLMLNTSSMLLKQKAEKNMLSAPIQTYSYTSWKQEKPVTLQKE